MTFADPSNLNRNLIALLLLSCLFFKSSISFSQIRCGTVEYTQKLRNGKNTPEQEKHFEDWLRLKTEKRKSRQSLGRTEETTYTIPVVVHIIHNGEPAGVGTNLSDEQVISQIDVLNDDFRRLNADTTNTPAEFLPVAGSMNIEFVLAQRTPEGLATNGIVRVQGAKTAWTESDDSQLKAQSYWPAEQYMNIWVCNLTDYLGYTQFPVSDLPGLEGSPDNRLTDGIVIWYKTFGSKNDGTFTLEPRYDLGRTLTHEMGHFFGLRHIWGDIANCGGTDYVDDTPNQNGSTNGCPTTEKAACDVNLHKMYPNYLDYTDDACMNLFTTDQVDRMITVLQNSPRRVSLCSSSGGMPPEPVPNDLGIKSIITPQASVCTTIVQPSLEIRNYGTNTITSAQIQLRVNAVAVETKTLSLNLEPLASATADFSNISMAEGSNSFDFEILQTNGTTDENKSNDTMHISVITHEPLNIPYANSFDLLPDNWIIKNPDHLYTWEATAAASAESGNEAMFINFYDYEDREGEQDILYSPVFDLSNESLAFLTFDVAYAPYESNSTDGLKVIALTNCNANLFTGVEIYNKYGGTLATTDKTKEPFAPNGQTQWRKEVINLSGFLGQSNVQFAFVGINGWGNNLYLDNFSLINSGSFLDISLKKIISPSIVDCSEVAPSLAIQNEGTQSISKVTIKYRINNGSYTSINKTGLNIPPGAEQVITLPEVTLQEGANTLEFTLEKPNDDETDINLENNSQSISMIVNNTSAIIPVRENFESAFTDRWTLINPKSGENWKTTKTNYGTSLYFNAYNNSVIDDEAWLVSPLLDFSETVTASVFFDRSYANNTSRTTGESLLVLASIGCGSPFDITLYDNSEFLANVNANIPWKPSAASDWVRDYINLISLTGKTDVRLAWVVSNGNGNNLYLDNIEFFTSDNGSPPQITEEFKVYGNGESPGDFSITFNLTEQQTVSIEILDMIGRTLFADKLTHVLNQTFPITLHGVNPGIYIVTVKTQKKISSTRVLISH